MIHDGRSHGSNPVCSRLVKRRTLGCSFVTSQHFLMMTARVSVFFSPPLVILLFSFFFSFSVRCLAILPQPTEFLFLLFLSFSRASFCCSSVAWLVASAHGSVFLSLSFATTLPGSSVYLATVDVSITPSSLPLLIPTCYIKPLPRALMPSIAALLLLAALRSKMAPWQLNPPFYVLCLSAFYH